jgi:hypothetical protein
MNSYAILLDHAFYTIQPIIIGFAALLFLVFGFAQVSSMRSSTRLGGKRPKISRIGIAAGIMFSVAIVVNFAVVTYLGSNARNEIGLILSGPVESVSANGTKIRIDNELVSALKNMCDSSTHHSHPTNYYRLTIKTTRGETSLDLRRDSEIANEYWVYFPKYYSTRLNEVGRVCTSAFDNMPAE